MQKPLKNQWFFNDFINLERLSLKQLEMKGFEESPVILTVIVWCMDFFMKRHVGTIRCNVFAVSILLFFYEAACRCNSLQRFCCVYFMAVYMKLHVGTIRCNVLAVSI